MSCLQGETTTRRSPAIFHFGLGVELILNLGVKGVSATSRVRGHDSRIHAAYLKQSTCQKYILPRRQKIDIMSHLSQQRDVS